MKKNKIISMMMTLCVLLAMSNIVFAGGLIPTPTPTAPTGMETMIETDILGAIQAIGTAVAIGMLLYVGIKYTLAAANEKANLKAASIRYVIGAIILFSLSNAFAVVEKVMAEVNKF